MMQEEETKREVRRMPMKAVTPSEHRQIVAYACRLLKKLEGGPHHRKYRDELEALTATYDSTSSASRIFGECWKPTARKASA